MGAKDLDALRKFYQEVDTDGSDSIDKHELLEALLKAGKAVKNTDAERIIKDPRYGSKVKDEPPVYEMNFEQFRLLNANFDDVMKEFNIEAAPKVRRNSRELGSRTASREIEVPAAAPIAAEA